MNEQEFVNELAKRGIAVSDKQLEQFKLYYETLISYNQQVNLTNIVEKEEVYLKHFYDSLSILFYHSFSRNCSLCDVGSGAGFPGIPLKIVRPDLAVTIIDSLGKRIDFINHLLKVLKLTDVSAIHQRAESYGEREIFTVVTARAVARLNILAEICIPLVKVGGIFIAMKGQTGTEEIKEAENAVTTLGCKLLNNYQFNLPGNGGARNIIIYTKIAKTPNKYPRNYGQIKNKPL